MRPADKLRFRAIFICHCQSEKCTLDITSHTQVVHRYCRDSFLDQICRARRQSPQGVSNRPSRFEQRRQFEHNMHNLNIFILARFDFYKSRIQQVKWGLSEL